MPTAQEVLQQNPINAQATQQTVQQTGVPTQGLQQAPAAPAEQAAPTTTQGGDVAKEAKGSDEPKMDAKTQQKVDSYVAVLMKELHGKDTRDDIIGILKSSSDPFMTVPQAAISVNDMAKTKIEKGGGRVDINTQFLGSQYLVADLMEIGNSFGIFKVGQEDFKDLYQDSLQTYIERGLKNGTIDPIELQLTGEKFMTQNQKIGGHYMAQEQDMPYEPQQTQMMKQFEATTRSSVKAEELDKQSKEAKQQNDQKIKQALLTGGK